MPDQYIDAPIEFDESALYQRAITRIQSYFPNWTPKSASLIDIVLNSCASMAAVGAEVASDVPADVFRASGALAHDPPINATAATIIATFTVKDTNGYDIPANTPVGLVKSGVTMDPIGFQTLNDVAIPSGLDSANITLQATIPGADTSGLDTVVRADSLTYVVNIIPIGISEGGNDAELTSDYLDRLSLDFESWTTTPIRGVDFARKARDIQGIYRCAYWENYNPADGTANNDKYVTLCPIDVNGDAVNSAVQIQLQQYIEGLREVNFVAPVVSPEYSSIDVTAMLHVPDPSLEASAITDAVAALQTLLNPSNWGIPPTGSSQSPVWLNTPIVRLSKVTSALESAPNVQYADQVEIGFSNPAPSEPAPTTADLGGTIAAGTYEVAVTYVNADGETVASVVASITTTSNTSTITIPSPPAPPVTAPAATGWFAYVSQAGGSTLTRQQAAGSPSAMGADFTLVAPPSNTGANPPSTNPRLGTADLVMPGAFPLPQAGSLIVTAVSP